MKKLFNRDLLYFVLLLCMIKVAIDLRDPHTHMRPTLKSPQSTQVFTLPLEFEEQDADTNKDVVVAIETIQENTIQDDVTSVEKKEAVPFEVHEVDSHVIKQIECAQNQIDTALEYIKPTSLDAAQLRSLQHKLAQLRQKYSHTSPAVALLGPLGTAAIVLKEEQLENELLQTVHKFGKIIHTIVGGLFEADDSIVKSLETNHDLVQQLIAV